MCKKTAILGLSLYDIEAHFRGGSCKGGIEISADPVNAAANFMKDFSDDENRSVTEILVTWVRSISSIYYEETK